jgi:excisionase family DNA binding protein
MEKLTLTVAEIAEQLNISLPTAYCLVKSYNFPSIRIGERRIVVPIEAFKRWMERNSGIEPAEWHRQDKPRKK